MPLTIYSKCINHNDFQETDVLIFPNCCSTKTPGTRACDFLATSCGNDSDINSSNKLINFGCNNFSPEYTWLENYGLFEETLQLRLALIEFLEKPNRINSSTCCPHVREWEHLKDGCGWSPNCPPASCGPCGLASRVNRLGAWDDYTLDHTLHTLRVIFNALHPFVIGLAVLLVCLFLYEHVICLLSLSMERILTKDVVDAVRGGKADNLLQK